MADVVLIEEDEPVSAFMADALRAAGHEVHTSSDVSRLLSLESRGTDLVIADIGPDTPPQQVVAAARALHPERPILLTTTYLQPLEERLLLQLGANAVLRKPFDLPTFLDLVDLLTLATRRNGRDTCGA